MQKESWLMMAVQCDVKACYLLLVNFHASLGDFRREITGRSLSLRCRAGGSGCGVSPWWVTVILEDFHWPWQFLSRILPLRDFLSLRPFVKPRIQSWGGSMKTRDRMGSVLGWSTLKSSSRTCTEWPDYICGLTLKSLMAYYKNWLW